MLLLDGRDVRALLDDASCIGAVEEAFRAYGLGEAAAPAICGSRSTHGSFHVKAGILERRRCYYAAKVNANFPANPKDYGLPTIQGVVVLFDAVRGDPLALMDSGELTVRRTAAATAVAAKYLAPDRAVTVTLCGCGVQGRAHVHALASVLRIRQIFAYDIDRAKADRFAREMTASSGLEVRAVSDLVRHTRVSDVCITCTPSRDYVLHAEDVTAGAFIAGVGVDDTDKRELAPDLLAESRVVVDILEQCASIGDLHHALDAGVLTRDLVHAELGEIVAGSRPARTSADERFVFDSTGMALQDVAAAALVYERAVEARRGIEFSLLEAVPGKVG